MIFRIRIWPVRGPLFPHRLGPSVVVVEDSAQSADIHDGGVQKVVRRKLRQLGHCGVPENPSAGPTYAGKAGIG